MGTVVIDEKLSDIMERLSDKLNKKRYLHSIGVMDTAACLAMKYAYDVNKARYAGILHDCAKNYSDEKLLEKAEKYKIRLSEVEKDNPDLLHSKVGMFVARDEYDIEDEDILNAIYCHTTGKPDMTLLEKIIFIADYIEPNRTSELPMMDEIRKMAFTDMNKCIVMICENSLKYLDDNNAKTDKITIDTYDYYKNL